MWWSVTPTFIEEDKDCVVSLDKKTSALYINKHMGSSLLYPRLDSDILIFMMILCVCVVFYVKKKKSTISGVTGHVDGMVLGQS